MTRVRLCFIQVGGMILNNKASLHFPATGFMYALAQRCLLVECHTHTGCTQPKTFCKYHVGLKRNRLKSISSLMPAPFLPHPPSRQG